MVMARWQATIQDEAGNVLPVAQVTVRREVTGAPLAALYSDRAGTASMGNPFTADADGFAAFHVAGGAYRIDVTDGSLTRTYRYVAIGLAAERDSVDPGVPFTIDTGVNDADPGAGALRFNNSTPALATQMFVSKTDADGVDVSAWLATLDDGGDTSDRGTLVLQGTGGATKVIATVTGTVTDASGYVKLAVTVLTATAASTFVQGARAGVTMTSNGADGVSTGDVIGPASSQAGQFPLFADGTGKLLQAGTAGSGSPVDELIVGTQEGLRAYREGHVLHAGLIPEASAYGAALTDAATVAWDWLDHVNAEVVLAGNRILGTPTQAVPGTWRTIWVSGNDGTDRALTFSSDYRGELPALTDIDVNRHYMLMIFCRSPTHFVVSSKRAFG